VSEDYRTPDWQYREAEVGEQGGIHINLSPTGRVDIRENLVSRMLSAARRRRLPTIRLPRVKSRRHIQTPLVSATTILLARPSAYWVGTNASGGASTGARDGAVARFELFRDPERRRRWSEEQKRMMVAAAFAPARSRCRGGAPVVRPGQIYRWRQELCSQRWRKRGEASAAQAY
jgi:hypothetical protein